MKILAVAHEATLGAALHQSFLGLGLGAPRLCRSAREARTALEGEPYSCVFLDLALPGGDSDSVLRAVKRRAPETPVVVVAGRAFMDRALDLLRKGAQDVLPSPFTEKDMALALERAARERALARRSRGTEQRRRTALHLEALNRELEERIREQENLFEISHRIDGIRSSDDLYSSIAGLAAGSTGVRKAGLFLWPPGQNRLLLISTHGMNGEEAALRGLSAESERLRRMCAEASGHVVGRWGEVFGADSGLPPGLSDAAFSCWPLRIRGEFFGLLMTVHEEGEARFSRSELTLLDFLMKKAAVAVENMALYESLVGSFYGILRSLVSALEAKDPYTGKHSERVTGYSVAIAGALGCAEGRVEALRAAGHLHDIGKIGIADGILTKPTALTAAEYDLVKRHPVIGESIVAELGLSREERAIIRNHHERWDGLGYPDGLAGDDIPFPARIIAVADAFDAMTSLRAYRRAMPEGEAFRELERNRGSQFDPCVVDAFIASRKSCFGPPEGEAP